MKHNQKTREIADNYAKSKGIKLNHEAKSPLNEGRAKKIAHAFEKMKHDPTDPKVAKAYAALITETVAQYQHLKKNGLTVTPITKDMKNPYKDSASMLQDVKDNHHLYFYPTELGFGGADDKTSDHPLLQKTNEKVGDKELVANDLFRIVHDYFGHSKEGTGFGPKGEEAAWQSHMQMYSPEAQKALTSETRGQNSWVNFGPHAENNRTNPANTIYAEQKAGLLPDWAMETDPEEKKFADGGDVPAGYSLKHHPPNIEVHGKRHPKAGQPRVTGHKITAHDSSNKEVGSYEFSVPHNEHEKHNIYADFSGTDKEHRRKGIASAAYRAIKQKYPDRDLVRTTAEDSQSEDAKAMWAAKKFADGGTVSFDDIQDTTPETTSQSLTGGPKAPSFDEMDDHSPKAFDDIQEASPTAKYETPGQQALTAVEGVGQGFLGPITTGAELGMHKLGLDSAMGIDTSAEAQVGRQQANPYIHGTAQGLTMAGSMMTGLGEAGMLAKGAKMLLPEAKTVLGKIGSAAIRNAIEMGSIQAGDEVSKAMLGQGSPEAPVSGALAHIGGAALLGGITGGTFNAAGQAGMKGLQAIENAKMGDRATDLLAGMGAAAKAHAAGVPEKEAEAFITNYFQDFGAADFKYAPYKAGVKAYYSGANQLVNKGVGLGADAVAGGIGATYGGPGGGYVAAHVTNKYVVPIVEKVLNKPLIGVTNKIAIPVIMKALSKGQTSGLFNALNHATNAAKGAKLIGNGIQSILKSTGSEMIDQASDKDKQKIVDYLDNGGVEADMEKSLQQEQPSGFAEGGPVANLDPGSIATLYPEQDMMMNAAKGRVSNYLMSLKPSKTPPKLPFDPPVDQTDATKTFNNAVGIAAAPLTVLNHIKNGTISVEQVKHFTSLYPEMHQYMSKEFTKGIMHANLYGETIPYKTRIALSLFMGAALDSTMTPVSIQAAQTTYSPKQQPVPMQGGKKESKESLSKLGKSNKSYKTADQSAESDRTSRK